MSLDYLGALRNSNSGLSDDVQHFVSTFLHTAAYCKVRDLIELFAQSYRQFGGQAANLNPLISIDRYLREFNIDALIQMYWDELGPPRIPDLDWRRLSIGERRSLSRYIRRLVGNLRADVYRENFREDRRSAVFRVPPRARTPWRIRIFLAEGIDRPTSNPPVANRSEGWRTPSRRRT